MIATIKRYLAVGNKPGSTNHGGVLPSVLFLFVIFSVVFVHELTSYRQEIQIYQQTRDYYHGRVLAHLTLSRVSPKVEDQEFSGEDHYNIGTVAYIVDDDTVQLVVILESGFRYELLVKWEQ